MKFILVSFFIVISKFGILQTLERKMDYSSLFKNETRSIEIKDEISLVFTNETWGAQKSQNTLIINYDVDSLSLECFKEKHPLEAYKKRAIKNSKKRGKAKRGWENYHWYGVKEKTGYIDNDSLLIMHSPRSNQFVYTQVAPLIEVHKSNLFIGGEWNSVLKIFKGFPSNKEFVGSLCSKYKVIGSEDITYQGNNISCWKIEAIGLHEKLGKNSTTFFYHESIGIISVHYIFYDGSEIILRLLEDESL